MGRFVCSCYNHNVSHHASFLPSRHPPSFAPRLLPASYLHPAHGIDPTHSLVASLASKRPWELQDDRHISTYLQTGIPIKPAPGCRMLWNLASGRFSCTRSPSCSAGHRPYPSARNSQSRLPSSPVLGGTGPLLAEKLRQHRLNHRVHVWRRMPHWIFCTPALLRTCVRYPEPSLCASFRPSRILPRRTLARPPPRIAPRPHPLDNVPARGRNLCDRDNYPHPRFGPFSVPHAVTSAVPRCSSRSFSSPIFGDSTAPASAALARRPALTSRYTPHDTILLSHVAPLSHLHPLCTHRHPASLRPHIPPIFPRPPSLHSQSDLLLLLARATPPCTGPLSLQALRTRRSSPARVFACLLFSRVLTICDILLLRLRDAVLYLLPLALW